jgi:hypothetical protein
MQLFHVCVLFSNVALQSTGGIQGTWINRCISITMTDQQSANCSCGAIAWSGTVALQSGVANQGALQETPLQPTA